MEAADGAEALQLAARSPPDLVLLDVMMPGMDGFEVCRRLRANPRLAEVPIIMITALDNDGSRLAGLEAGPPDVSATIAERGRLGQCLRSLGLEPLPSFTNFVLVPHERAGGLYDALLHRGLAVRPSPSAIRITVHRPDADDRLLAALAELV